MPSKQVFSVEEIEAFLASRGTGYKFTASPTAGVAPYLHGAGGLFSTPGLDPSIFSALQLPNYGLLDNLPVMPAGTAALELDNRYGGYDSPLYATFTGITAGDLDDLSNQPTEACSDPPVPGKPKICIQTAPFGHFEGRTNPIDLKRVARLTNRSEPTDLRIMNNPNPETTSYASSLFGGGMRGNVTSELNSRLFSAAVGFKRGLAPLTYTGNPANTAASNNYKQFTGLDLLINVGGHVDAITGNICTALDSQVYDFESQLITATGKDIVDYVDSLYYNVSWNATREGFAPTTWANVMRPELFEEIVKVWPVRYYQEALAQIAAYTNGRVVLDARDTTQQRDAMRQGSYLPVRGQLVPVIQDDTIPYTQPLPGVFESDMYIVPKQVLGAIPALYLEAFNYAAGNISEFVNFAGLNSSRFTTSDAGRFLWWSSYTNTCIDLRFCTDLRLILRTPQLAGRIDNIRYSPLVHPRDWNPNNTSFYVDGGNTGYPATSYYTEWSPTTPVVIGA